MSGKPHIVVPVLIGATLLSLVAKKLMLPFASAFTVISLDALAVYYLVSSLVVQKDRKTAGVKYVNITLSSIIDFISTLALLINIQHWRGADLWAKITFILLLAHSFIIILTFDIYRKMSKGDKKRAWLASYISSIFFFIMITLCVVLTPRQFHNLFYGNTYEQFVRQKYPEEIADEFINLSKPVDERSLQRAQHYYDEAVKAYTKEDYEEALNLLNKSIDINPDHAESYYQRGVLKFTELELSKYSAQEAINDFNRAIRLKPDMAAAYFQRAMARRYLFNTDKAHANDLPLIKNDISKAASLDTVYHQFDSLVK